jgi:fermentation-respiration switch protein FrsA (DUF1100 family)
MWQVSVGLVGLTSAALLFAGNYFFHEAQARYTPSNHPDPLQEAGSSLYQDEQDFLALSKETWTIQTPDELTLKAWYVPADAPTNKTAVLAHGWHNNKTTMAVYGQLFHSLGYNVLVPDQRTSGESEGKYIGYGWLERRDFVQWLQQIVKQNGEDSQLVMMGMSMGAATTMMVSGEPDVPKQLKTLIADSGYTTVQDELSYQAGAMYGLPAFPLVNIVSGISKVRAGYSYPEASAINQLAHNTRPILFIHGDADDFVPTDMVHDLYAATRGPKELWITKDAGHVDSLAMHREAYYARVSAFLKQYNP